MINKFFSPLLLLFITTFSSFANSKKDSLLHQFKDAGSIELKKLNFVSDKEIKDAIGLCFYKDHLLSVDYSPKNKFITIVNLKDQKVSHQVSRGRGKYHLLSPRPVLYNPSENCISVFDDRLSKIINYDLINSELIEKSVTKNFYDKKQNLIGRAIFIDSTRILTDGIFAESDQKYQIHNLKNNSSIYFGAYPNLKSNLVSRSGENFLSLQGTFAIHPDSNKAVYASCLGAVIDFINLESENRNINRKTFFTPIVEIISVRERKFSVRPFQYGKGTLTGFRSVKATANYVYALFIGNEYIPCGSKITEEMKAKQQTPTLLQFDWNGNPVKRWNFKQNIANFDINPETNEIYVMTKDHFTLWVGQL